MPSSANVRPRTERGEAASNCARAGFPRRQAVHPRARPARDAQRDPRWPPLRLPGHRRDLRRRDAAADRLRPGRRGRRRQRSHRHPATARDDPARLRSAGTAAHDWLADESSRGTWAIHRPGWYEHHHAAMQAPEGQVVLAGSDLANGWAGFIDGAIESGFRAARRALAL
ncbi:MAG: FAD-dependent oxidoreductase [Solirubrobacterales bacterium]|nr:FAD-dependent oxidoreductase [Solirubrobacterales bacterium]